MTETDFSLEIKKALRRQILLKTDIKYDYQRLESHATIQGLPDVNLCVERLHEPPMEIWLELKIGSNKPSPLQIGWALRRWELGQKDIYCLRAHPTGVIFEYMYQYWLDYPLLPKICLDYDQLAYRLLTGEFKDGHA